MKYQSKSTTKSAKKIIRKEMLSYFPASEYGKRTNLDAMRYNAETVGKVYHLRDDYSKGKQLVDDGACAFWNKDQAKMLGKIYGKANVATWSGQKVHDTYTHLIGREYSAMLKEQRKGGRK